jgi:exonuclease VII small subunit
LDELVKAVEQPNADLSEIAGKVKRAVELVAFCREYLKGLQNDADKILT